MQGALDTMQLLAVLYYLVQFGNFKSMCWSMHLVRVFSPAPHSFLYWSICQENLTMYWNVKCSHMLQIYAHDHLWSDHQGLDHPTLNENTFRQVIKTHGRSHGELIFLLTELHENLLLLLMKSLLFSVCRIFVTWIAQVLKVLSHIYIYMMTKFL